MKSIRGAVRYLFRSGWTPALIVVAFAIALVDRGADVRPRDSIMFAGYLAIWIVFPGTVVWRWVDRRRNRPLVEDLAIGALVGYVLEFPVYAAGLAVGVPQLYLGWPVVVVVATVTHRRGRVLLRGNGVRMSPGWSWSIAALIGYVIAWFGHNVWAASPIRSAALREPYVDEPFHLSLATGLKHFFPPQVTYVADTPLDYHWLSHLHVAAASWVTGVEPVVLLRSLAIPALFCLVALATATIAMRLTNARWTGPVALGALMVAPANFSGWSDGAGEALLSNRLVLSPSAGFVNAALLLGLLLCVELLRRDQSGWPAWVLTGLTFVAMAGAKSTSLPALLAGLVAAAVVASVTSRSLHHRGLALVGCALVALAVAKLAFFGSGTHGLAIDPLALARAQARVYSALLDRSGNMSLAVSAIAVMPYLSYLTLGAGQLALLSKGGWRRPEWVFLIATCAAGFGAGFTFHQSAFSEYYFIYVVFLPMLLGAVLGLHHVTRELSPEVMRVVGPLALVSAALAGLAYTALTRPVDGNGGSGSSVAIAFQLFALPLLVTLALCIAVVVLLLSLVPRRLSPPPLRRQLTLPSIVLVLAGMGFVPFLRSLPQFVTHPLPEPGREPAQTLIGEGGIAAARWLRAHSHVDDIIATNAHCELPKTSVCIPRNFWMAGYSERRVLVEGWSYISRSSVGLPAPADENTTVQPFWDPALLQLNDEAFEQPSASTIEALEDRGVVWLLVDKRFPVDMAALRDEASPVFRSGRYAVLRLHEDN